ENSNEFRLFQSKSHKLTHAFTVSVDLDAAKRNPALDPFELTIASRIEDERTQSDKMMAYILNLEDTISKFGVFTRPPQFTKPDDAIMESDVTIMGTPIAFPRGHLKNSRFYSQLQLNAEQVNRFIYLSEADMWSALEKVYGV